MHYNACMIRHYAEVFIRYLTFLDTIYLYMLSNVLYSIIICIYIQYLYFFEAQTNFIKPGNVNLFMARFIRYILDVNLLIFSWTTWLNIAYCFKVFKYSHAVKLALLTGCLLLQNNMHNEIIFSIEAISNFIIYTCRTKIVKFVFQ